MHRLMTAFGVALGLAVVGLYGAPALGAEPGTAAPAAKASERRVLVLDFEGAQALGMRGWVAARLRKVPGVVVVPKADALGERPAPKDAAGVVEVAKSADVCAVVSGKTVGKGGKWTLTLVVTDGASGEPIDTVIFESTWIKGIKQKLDATGVERLGPVIERCQTPAQAAAAAEAEAKAKEDAAEADEVDEADEERARAPEPEPEEKPKPKPERARPAPFEVEVGLPLFNRRFRYEEDVTQTLRSYRVEGLAPGVVAALAWYPAAHFTGNWAAHLGLTGRYFHGFPAAAEREGREFDTATHAYRFGLRVRIPVRPLELGVRAEYGAHAYTVDRDPVTSVPLVPNVDYRFVRPGIGVRLRVGAFVAELEGGARIVLDTGELESALFFPNLTGYGLDGSVAVGAAFGPVTLLAGGAIERYRFDLRPSPVSPSPFGVAGVAIDRTASVALSVRLTLGGGE